MLDDEVVYFAFMTLGIFEIAPYQLLTKRDRRSSPQPPPMIFHIRRRRRKPKGWWWLMGNLLPSRLNCLERCQVNTTASY
ncbi:hypothetical protein T07_11772 [Trichinella nelsoni]|uniref:Uncharacterized protein n=1 Tax=Trichinella nelsoni TaxID=6336 RepID=A0A0V0SCV3_9BILA|nr:hypothetical protein T07_11772 [Trichinella nelsoni]